MSDTRVFIPSEGDPPVGSLEDRLADALRTVHDPEIPVNLYDLGLIYRVEIAPDNALAITMTLTTPNCPVAGELPRQIEQAATALEDVPSAKVDLVWEPRWTPEMMTDDARFLLDSMGVHIPQHGDPHQPAGPRRTDLTIGRKPGERPQR